MEPRIAVIVLNWNGRTDTLACLDSLKSIEYANWEALVVDNGSEDGSVAAIRQQHPSLTVIEAGANLGFAAGNNLGITEALRRGAEFLFILNNDTVVAPDVLRTLAGAAMEHKDAGALGPKIYYLSDPARLWFAEAEWSREASAFKHGGQGAVDTDQDTGAVRETDYVCGCAMFLRASAIRQVGQLEPSFFLLFEEIDWCFRARLQGYSCIIVPSAKIWHKVSSSFGGSWSPLYDYFYIRNRLLWAERHLPKRDRRRVWRRTLIEVYRPWSDLCAAMLGFMVRARSRRQVYWTAHECLNMLAPIKGARERAHIRARSAGMMDYLLRRFGNCPPRIRTLNRRASEAGLAEGEP